MLLGPDRVMRPSPNLRNILEIQNYECFGKSETFWRIVEHFGALPRVFWSIGAFRIIPEHSRAFRSIPEHSREFQSIFDFVAFQENYGASLIWEHSKVQFWSTTYFYLQLVMAAALFLGNFRLFGVS